MNADHLLTLKCAACPRAQVVVVQRSDMRERLEAIRAVGWEPDADHVRLWCPEHTP